MKAARGFSPLRDLPTLGWLLATVVSTFVHPWVPAPRWLMIHLLLLGAITHAILVWSTHFADALLHLRVTDADLRQRSWRLGLLNLAVLTVVVGMVTSRWPVVLVGAVGVAAAVVWHGASLLARSRQSLTRRLRGTLSYYLAAACLLPVGATLGVLLARQPGEQWHDRLVVAHAAVNVLGWVGLTVVGTLLTLWPTILRTRMLPGAERAAARALPILLVALVGTVAAALLAPPPAVAAGVAGYLVGLGLIAPAFVLTAREKPPAAFPGWSVLSGVVWLLICLASVAVGFAQTTSWSQAGHVFATVTPLLAAGFVAQVLLGALSYLVPVALGGGPTPVRAANAMLDRGGALRVVVVNAGIAVCALPVPSVVRVLASLAALGGFIAFLPLLISAIRASRRAKAELDQAPRGGPRPPTVESDPQRRGRLLGQAATGLSIIALVVAAGVSADPIALSASGAGESASAGVSATGQTTRVRVEAADMRFTPDRIEVPAGNRLVLEVVNTDDGDVHDLVLDSGADSGRLRPGESATVDVGVVGRDLDGWCSVLGHRSMGMVLTVAVIGGTIQAADQDPDGSDHSDHGGHGSGGVDLHGEPAADFEARDARLDDVPDARLHRHTFRVREFDREVAPGVTAHLWGFDGSAPGPLLHGKVGDVFEITLVNDGTIGHSIDFHAGSLAPDRPMRTIAPGESLVYRFTATMAGIWMYHCSTMPMSAHIANGMFGAVIIEPPDLPTVDRSYALVQSELYLGADGEPVDVAKVNAETPDAVVFNGYANQYAHRPLPARVGERVRVWVLDAGPNRPTSFHVVGGQFDTVWKEGAYLLRGGPGGSQALDLMPAQGGFVELTFPEAGHYPFVSHLMIDAERGASGLFAVTDD